MAYSTTTTERTAVSEQLIINAILPGLSGVKPNRARGGWSFFCPLEHRKKDAPAAIWVNSEGWISVHCFDCRRNDELRQLLVAPHLRNLPTAPPVAPRPSTTSSRRQPQTDYPVRIWAETTAIPNDADHPARRWFANRNLWRPEVTVPTALRWLPASLARPGPHTGAGSLAALLAKPDDWARAWPLLPDPRAVEIIAVDREGNPALDRPQQGGGLGKRTLGTKAGAVLVLGNPLLSEAEAPVRVAEGVADALALAARFAGPVVASMGDAGMTAEGFAGWLAGAVERVVIHADNDEAGQRAASRLCGAVRIHGGTARAVLPAQGKDSGVVAGDNPFAALTEELARLRRHPGRDERLAPLGSPAPGYAADGRGNHMTTHNGHHHAAAFEGAELTPDMESQALLDLMGLADDIEAGRLTAEGHRLAQEALAVLRRDAERGPASFRQAVAMAQADLRGSLETLTRAIETATPLRVTTWGSTLPEPRRWLIDERLPAGRVALLTGEGGAGKSRLALQLAAGVASGGNNREWITGPHGMMRLGSAVPEDGAGVVFASWEDEPEEFYRRLHQISGQPAPWVKPDRLERLRIVNLVGEGPVWAPAQGRHISTMAELTVTGERLRRLCEHEDARLLVLDPLAAAYASDENARGLVRAFVSHWDAWGQANNCAVLILAHPPKSAGMNYAGSTDWQGAARALWTLQADIDKSAEASPRTWKLEFVKGNYGPRPEPLRLRWDTGGAGLRWEVIGETQGDVEGGYEVDS